jgi:hypothetical protein
MLSFKNEFVLNAKINDCRVNNKYFLIQKAFNKQNFAY